jgi:hypothetical protein
VGELLPNSYMLTRIHTRSGRCFFEAIMQQHQVVCSLSVVACPRRDNVSRCFTSPRSSRMVMYLQKNLDTYSFLFRASRGYTLHAMLHPSRMQEGEDMLHHNGNPDPLTICDGGRQLCIADRTMCRWLIMGHSCHIDVGAPHRRLCSRLSTR